MDASPGEGGSESGPAGSWLRVCPCDLKLLPGPGHRNLPGLRPLVGAHWTQGGRPYMEDELAIELGVAGLPIHFVGVFDGHAGRRCARLAARSLCGLVQAAPGFGREPLDEPVRAGFDQVEAKFLTDARRLRMPDGSTACTVWLDTRAEPWRLLSANLGDSRAVLCRKGEPVALTVDHKPQHPRERRMVEARGGRVIRDIGCSRVNGVLAVARALGDLELKPEVGSEPELLEYEVQPEDLFVVVGSDGLWDVVTNKMAVNSVLKDLRLAKSLNVCAERLVGMARRKGSQDNITAVVLLVQELCRFDPEADSDGGDESG